MSGADLLAAIDARVELVSVLWLLPIVFVFHDFEEILTVENWLARRGETVLGKMPAFARRLLADSFRMNTRLFAQDVLWVYSFIVAAASAAVFFRFYEPFLMILAVFFLHVFTHAGQAAALRCIRRALRLRCSSSCPTPFMPIIGCLPAQRSVGTILSAVLF